MPVFNCTMRNHSEVWTTWAGDEVNVHTKKAGGKQYPVSGLKIVYRSAFHRDIWGGLILVDPFKFNKPFYITAEKEIPIDSGVREGHRISRAVIKVEEVFEGGVSLGMPAKIETDTVYSYTGIFIQATRFDGVSCEKYSEPIDWERYFE